jgi:hypothetical protein
MNWSDILKILAGPIIGAVIALVAIWLKEVFEKKKSVQSWFEQYYIIEGVDRLISHFLILESSVYERNLANILGSSSTASITAEPLSPDVIAKVEAIFQNRIFLVSALFIRGLIRFEFTDKSLEKRAMAECLKLAKMYNGILTDLRKELLKVELKHKTDIYKLASENAAITKLLDRMHSTHIEAIKKLGISFQVDDKGHLRMELE